MKSCSSGFSTRLRECDKNKGRGTEFSSAVMLGTSRCSSPLRPLGNVSMILSVCMVDALPFKHTAHPETSTDLITFDGLPLRCPFLWSASITDTDDDSHLHQAFADRAGKNCNAPEFLDCDEQIQDEKKVAKRNSTHQVPCYLGIIDSLDATPLDFTRHQKGILTRKEWHIGDC